MALRLTLRTLLAYLDDTLQASEIKEIGQKVTESDAAQELIARIKQVTRRRRLTVPPATGPNGMDANDVSEYLDNVLTGDQIGDVEKQALESDVHLAEIAACHQILTLVLGEPALVPPKAKERMYTIVQGRGMTPAARKPERVKTAASTGPDEETPLGLSVGWLRWVLPVAGVLLVAALGLAVYKILPSRTREVVQNRPAVPDEPSEKPKEKEPVKQIEKVEPVTKVTPVTKVEPIDKDKPEIEKRPAVEIEHSTPPSTKRSPFGNYVTLPGLPHAVVTRDDKGEWQMLRPSAGIFTDTTYTALPGFVGVLKTKTGVGVLLRGHLRDFTLVSVMEDLMESAVVLHASDKFDLDLTLLRGRIFLTNQKDNGACKIRLRFEAEIWDITLANKGDEILVDLSRAFNPTIDFRAGEAPRARCFLILLRGDADLKIDAYHTYNLEAEPRKWVLMHYDSDTKTKGPFKEASNPAIASKQPPDPTLFPENARVGLQKMNAALNGLEVMLTKKIPAVALQETLEKTDLASRLLAVYCLASVDEIGKLIDVLGDGDTTHSPDRVASYFTLQRWISRSATQGKQLYEEKNGTAGGVLIDKKFKKREAERILVLLHPFLAENLRKVETYEDLVADLTSSRIAIAEMAYHRLHWLALGVKLPTNFNAAASIEDRERYALEIQKLIDKKVLPPTAPAAPPPVPPAEKGDPEKR